MIIWQFKTKNFIVRMSCDYDQDSVDLSWDDTGEVAEKLESGEWAVYTFHAEVIERATDNTIGEDYLGGSIYGDPADFRDHVGLTEKGRKDGHSYGSYFTDMIREAIEEARKTYAKPRPPLKPTEEPDEWLAVVTDEDGDRILSETFGGDYSLEQIRENAFRHFGDLPAGHNLRFYPIGPERLDMARGFSGDIPA